MSREKVNESDLDFSKHVLTITKSPDNSPLKYTEYKFKKPDTGMYAVYWLCIDGCTVIRGDLSDWYITREFHPDSDNYLSRSYCRGKMRLSTEQSTAKFDADETHKFIYDEYINKHNELANIVVKFFENNNLNVELLENLVYNKQYCYYDFDVEEITEEIKSNDTGDYNFDNLSIKDFEINNIDDILSIFETYEFISNEELEYLDSLLDTYDEIEYTHKAYRENVGRFEDYDYIPFVKKEFIHLTMVFDAFDEMCDRIKNGDYVEN